MSIIVLESEWDRGDDPVRIFDDGPCFDLNNQRYKPRCVLLETSRTTKKDCEHSVSYNVVFCDIVETGAHQ